MILFISMQNAEFRIIYGLLPEYIQLSIMNYEL